MTIAQAIFLGFLLLFWLLSGVFLLVSGTVGLMHDLTLWHRRKKAS